MKGTAVTHLTTDALSQLDSSVAVPGYKREGLVAGIVHFGVGGFHRSHQAVVIDTLLKLGLARDFAICGIGVLEHDRTMRDVLRAQDGLYTLLVKHPDGVREARVIGSIIEYLFAPDDPEAVIEKLASPDTRIVSLTITEGGYTVDQVTGEFDAQDASIRHDLAEGAVPRTVVGLITEGLRRRRERSIPPFTIMSCDNIEGNGRVARAMVSGFAGLRDAELGAWIAREVAFPSSMVDRITPATTSADRHDVSDQFGIEDGWPVTCEPFFQWVLEESFGDGRPPFEDAGVQLVDDVEPYELMKLRLLNASHQGLAYFGHLAGYRFAHDAAADPALAAFLLAYMTWEATPTLKPVPGIDLDDYRLSLIERFRNKEIGDTIARLCADSSDRIPKFLLPVVRLQSAAGGEIARSAAIVASWARYAEGVDEKGDPIEVVDRLAVEVQAIARTQRENPTAFIENRAVFGDLADDEWFVSAYVSALHSLHAYGARQTYGALSTETPAGLATDAGSQASASARSFADP